MKRAAGVTKQEAEFARTFGSSERVEWVRKQPCVCCGRRPSVNAHVGSKGKGAGRRADYDQIVPLCARCHDECDGRSRPGGIETFKRKYAIDLDSLAAQTEQRWQQELAARARRIDPSF